jgi:hypothetical protein
MAPHILILGTRCGQIQPQCKGRGALNGPQSRLGRSGMEKQSLPLSGIGPRTISREQKFEILGGFWQCDLLRELVKIGQLVLGVIRSVV